MNRVNLVGYISTDLVLDKTESGIPYTRFQLAVKDRGAVDFLPIIAWRGIAKAIVANVKKGDQIGIDGKIKTNNYESKEGKKMYQTDIKVAVATFIGDKNTKQVVDLPETKETQDQEVGDYYKAKDDDSISF